MYSHAAQGKNAADAHPLARADLQLHGLADWQHQCQDVDQAVCDRVANEVEDQVNTRPSSRIGRLFPCVRQRNALEAVGNKNGEKPANACCRQHIDAFLHKVRGKDAPVEGQKR